MPEASGITGPANVSRGGQCNDLLALMQQPFGPQLGGGNNFNGFLTCGLYADWLFAKDFKCGPGGILTNPNDTTGQFDACFSDTERAPTGCKPVVSDFGAGESGADIPFNLQSAATYTDEHGEARVFFWPGQWFFFLNLPGVAINANGGCDLANIPGGILGTAALSATARYPFEPVTARPVVSNTIARNVTSAFSKSITCYPKGTQPEERNAAICVAQAIDITGHPFFEETVCFMADFNAEDIQPFPAANPGVGTVTTATPPFNVAVIADGVTPMPDNRNEARRGRGPASYLHVHRRLREGGGRDLQLEPDDGGCAGAVRGRGDPAPPAGAVPDHGPGRPRDGRARFEPDEHEPGHRTAGSKPAVKVEVAKVKLVRHSRTRASVTLRVTGPNVKVPVRLRFQARTKVVGKRSMTFARTVRTNRLVTISGLRTPNAKRLALRVSLSS